MKQDKDSHKKVKILCIGPLPPPVHGSAIMTQIIKDSTYINERVELDWVNLSTSRKMEEIGHRSAVKILRFVSSYLKTLGKLLTRKYDICYLAITCHGLGFIKDAPFVLICKLLCNKIIIHQHNKGMAAYSDRYFYRWLLKKVYRGVRVILLSWRLYPDIARIVDRSQIRICPNGIPEVHNFVKEDSVRPTILFLSNMMESKGVLTILDACQILKERGYDFKCRFVGGETIEINNSRFNSERTSRNLDGMVEYVGRKYGDEKHKEFSNADIFVLPTNDDCFPLVLLEAMQHELPIVSTKIGGIPDMVEENVNGIIIPTKNPEKLAYALSDLLDSPQKRKRLGRNGKEKYNSKYTIRKFEENILLCMSEHK